MKRNNISYLERRAAEEAEAATRTRKPVIASAHRLLALQYEDDARALKAALAFPGPEAA